MPQLLNVPHGTKQRANRGHGAETGFEVQGLPALRKAFPPGEAFPQKYGVGPPEGSPLLLTEGVTGHSP